MEIKVSRRIYAQRLSPFVITEDLVFGELEGERICQVFRAYLTVHIYVPKYDRIEELFCRLLCKKNFYVTPPKGVDVWQWLLTIVSRKHIHRMN